MSREKKMATDLAPATYSVSTFRDPYYLLGVYSRCLLAVSTFRSSASVNLEVSAFGDRYYLVGVYFLWSVLPTRCLLSVSTLRASTFRRDRGVYLL